MFMGIDICFFAPDIVSCLSITPLRMFVKTISQNNRTASSNTRPTIYQYLFLSLLELSLYPSDRFSYYFICYRVLRSILEFEMFIGDASRRKAKEATISAN